jgi:hypothetical protein
MKHEDRKRFRAYKKSLLRRILDMIRNEVIRGIPKIVPYYEVHGLYFSSYINGASG